MPSPDAGVDLDTIYAFQLIDEMWIAGPDPGFAKFTSVAASPRKGRTDENAFEVFGVSGRPPR